MGLPPELFRSQIATAKQRIQKLRSEERKIRDEIVDLRNLIRANINFLPDPERTAQMYLLDLFQQPSNIGEVVRATLAISTFIASEGIKLADIKGVAEYMFGFDFAEYTNPAASIATTLRRMRDAGQVTYDEAKETYKYEGAEFLDIMNPELMERIAKQAVAEVRAQIGDAKMTEIFQKLGQSEAAKYAGQTKKSKSGDEDK